MKLNDDELEAMIDLIDVAFDTDSLGKLGRKTSNVLRSAQYKFMIERKLSMFVEGMKNNDQNVTSG